MLLRSLLDRIRSIALPDDLSIELYKTLKAIRKWDRKPNVLKAVEDGNVKLKNCTRARFIENLQTLHDRGYIDLYRIGYDDTTELDLEESDPNESLIEGDAVVALNHLSRSIVDYRKREVANRVYDKLAPILGGAVGGSLVWLLTKLFPPSS